MGTGYTPKRLGKLHTGRSTKKNNNKKNKQTNKTAQLDSMLNRVLKKYEIGNRN